MMSPPISGRALKVRNKAIRYDALFFDFDGVLVESAKIKTQAFRSLYADYGDDVIAQVVTHHGEHEGISRVEKIRYCHKAFLDQDLSDAELEMLAARYSSVVFDAVVECPGVPGGIELLQQNLGTRKMFVVSGTPQTELRDIVQQRGMTHFFEAVCGSPRRKEPIVEELLARFGLAANKCLFIGDAMTDYRAAQATGLDFIGRVSAGNASPFPEGTVVVSDLTEFEQQEG